MKLDNLKRYQPEEPPFGENTLYLIDEHGRDWYEAQSKFTKAIKLAIDARGIIRSIATDVSTLFPENLSVVEVDSIPDACNIGGNWLYANGEVKEREPSRDEVIAQAEKLKAKKLSDAAIAIAPLQDAVDLGIATEAEIALLKEWKTYRVALNRVALDDGTGIEWPIFPHDHS
ncbi:TPA: tail fiber assembly protein [Serratia marcescens]|nr:tail fiber assembly protein [Serratia marcescens]